MYKVLLTKDELQIIKDTIDQAGYPGKISELVTSVREKLNAAEEVKEVNK
jgi:hypothetical protein